jgi:hypothetical protein
MEPFAALDDGLLVRRFMDEFKFSVIIGDRPRLILVQPY